jgi:hypothetical protein
MYVTKEMSRFAYELLKMVQESESERWTEEHSTLFAVVVGVGMWMDTSYLEDCNRAIETILGELFCGERNWVGIALVTVWVALVNGFDAVLEKLAEAYGSGDLTSEETNIVIDLARSVQGGSEVVGRIFQRYSRAKVLVR